MCPVYLLILKKFACTVYFISAREWESGKLKKKKEKIAKKRSDNFQCVQYVDNEK